MISKKITSYVLSNSIVLMFCICTVHSTEILFDQNNILKNTSNITVQKFNVKEMDPLKYDFEQDLISSKERLLKVNARILKQAKEKDFTALKCVASFYLEGVVLKEYEDKGINILLWLAQRHDANAMHNIHELCERKGFNEQSENWKQLSQTYGYRKIITELED